MNENQICAYCDEIRETTLKQLYKIQNQRKEISMLHKKCKSQQAEIEMWKSSAELWEGDAKALFISRESIKAEAVKEFAERLKDKQQLVKARFSFGGEYIANGVMCADIDNLVKEMVGEG